ncbi:hypothetical protein [Massilia sp. DWR3-1-1]|uniref:hypothetical protein n=1 Tax=Massilia sp. DWR3-1-1 TaxID=2804559 RepID=UPI003CF0D01D
MIARTAMMVAAALLCGSACAAVEDAVPSCYDHKLGVTAAASSTELFILVDQTTLFDATLQQQVADNVRLFMGPGNAFSIMTFSAFSQGRYAQVVSAGNIEAAIGAGLRDDISKPLLNKFDACAKRQPQIAMQAIGTALRTAFAGANPDLAKSDVMASFKSMSSRVKNSPASRKIVLIASDMLENSSVSSFYDGKGMSVKNVDPAREIKLAADNDLFGDFGGARIYVIGAGLLSDDAKKGSKYRDPKTMRSLINFWNQYFQKSNAAVVEIGQPALLNNISLGR